MMSCASNEWNLVVEFYCLNTAGISSNKAVDVKPFSLEDLFKDKRQNFDAIECWLSRSFYDKDKNTTTTIAFPVFVGRKANIPT